MEKHDDAPKDVKRAAPVEREINKGQKDDTFEGYPQVVEKKKRWEHCDKPPSKRSKANSIFRNIRFSIYFLFLPFPFLLVINWLRVETIKGLFGSDQRNQTGIVVSNQEIREKRQQNTQ